MIEEVTISRNQRIKMFFYEYYVGVGKIFGLLRLFGGPIYCLMGVFIFEIATDRLEIAFAGFLIVFSIYNFFKPFWWVILFWKNYRTISFRLQLGDNQMMIEEDGGATQIDYSRFDKISKRPSYFSLRIEKGRKIYLPLTSLSAHAIETLETKCD